jgi:gamma-glutamyltranspeptidase/glutathione hydrolase
MKRNKTLSILIAFVFLQLVSCSPKIEIPSGENGMVVTAHYIASEVGCDILKQGGNAYDAAVAVQFALAVAYPRAGNIAGGGFAVVRTANGEYNTLDFREKAPSKAHERMYLDDNNKVIENLSQTGHLAVGVPGTVDGMAELHKKYGKLAWEELLKPAIKLAKQGVIMSELEANKLNDYRERIKKVNTDNNLNPYLKTDLFKKGDTLINTQLASCLERILKKGRDGFYEGITADLIVREMQEHNGIINHDDLKAYKSIWRPAMIGSYRNCKIISMPPPSSGGIALIQLLKGADLHNMNKYKFGSFEHLHLMVELERRVYADRATWLGDPDYYEVPDERLVSKDYLKGRFEDISFSKKTNSQDVKAGTVELIESFETTHFSIVDKEGNAIAITTTLNGNYGSKVVVNGGGFFLNNEMDDFSIKTGYPNQFGLVGGKANAIEPGKRMLSSMTPTIVEKDGELFMVLGSPGGSTIITSVFQNIINAVDFNMTAREAVNAPRIHSQWLPDKVYVEPTALNDSIRTKMEAMGHLIQDQSRLGMMANIAVSKNGRYIGAADTTRHKDSKAKGY